MFGLPDKDLGAIRGVLREFSSIEQVLIYGSRAKGNARAGSDIDLVLYGNVSDAELSRLLSELDELNTPYLFDVIRYADIDSDDLRAHISRVGKRFDS